MLTVVCGEDIVSSRAFLNQLRQSFTREQSEVRDIAPGEIGSILDWQGANMNLFSAKTVFFTERLESLIIRRRGKKPAKRQGPATLEDIAIDIARRRDIELIDWEQKPGRDVKLKNDAQVREFKPSSTIFRLLDACYPGNMREFVTVLEELSLDQDEMFIFIMLYRHIRALVAAYDNAFSRTCPPWQKHKLTSQARLFKQEKLVEFYEGLSRLEATVKSGTNPHGVRKTLEILSCYYL